MCVSGGDAQIRTGDKGFAGPCLATWPRRHPCARPLGEADYQDRRLADQTLREPTRPAFREFDGADDGIRTRDPNLGKVVLYQLSHVRAQARSLATRIGGDKGAERRGSHRQNGC